jgi:hypothetical protein
MGSFCKIKRVPAHLPQNQSRSAHCSAGITTDASSNTISRIRPVRCEDSMDYEREPHTCISE